MSATPGDVAPYRRLWASVLLTVFEDSWAATRNARGDAVKIAAARANALRYFQSRDGRTVAALAGVAESPDRMADMAVDLRAKRLTVKEPRCQAHE